MARLTGEDADGHIISTEEEWLLASNGFISKDEMYKIPQSSIKSGSPPFW